MAATARPFPFARVKLNAYALAVATVAGIGVGLRFYNLGAHFLSYDETFTFLMAGRALPDLIRAAAGDVHPPLSYLMYWAFVRLAGATTPLTLRLPDALLGSYSIWQFYQLTKRLNFGRLASLAALALFACAPFEIHYSQDARMYALLQFAVLAALLEMFDRRYWRMGFWLAVACWTQNYGLFYTAVVAVAAFLREMERPVIVAADPALGWQSQADAARPRQVALAVGVALSSWLPWSLVVFQQMRTLSSGYWILPLDAAQAIYPLFPLLWGVALPDQLNALGALVAVGLVAFAIFKAFRLKRYRLLVWLMLGPALLAAGVSVLTTPIYLYRALIGCLPPLLLLLAWALTDGTERFQRGWALAIIAPLFIIGNLNRMPALQQETADNAVALQTVLAGYQPGDVVYHGNVGSLTGFLTAGPSWLPNYLMTVQAGSVGVLTQETRRALGFCEGELTPGQLITSCGTEPYKRVWLVWGASQTISGTEDHAIAQILEHYPNVKKLDIHDVYHGPQPVDGGIWLLTKGGAKQ